MDLTQYVRVSPQIEPLLSKLTKHDVHFVVFGSGGALVYGAKIVPGDLDICPSLTPDNLRRLAAVLGELGAHPRIIPGWMTAEESGRWNPVPHTEENVDHLFETVFGDFDVVPRPYGPEGQADRFDYERLNERAATLPFADLSIRVAGIEDLIASKMSRRRDKDIAAWPELQKLHELYRSS